MTHERMKARIKELQEYYSWQRPPTATCSIFFVDARGSREGCNVARDYNGWSCRRLPGDCLGPLAGGGRIAIPEHPATYDTGH